jgi:phage head maturation protease
MKHEFFTREAQDDLLQREASFAPRSWNEAQRTFEATFATANPVRRQDQRGEYDERLAITQENVERARGAVVLDSHNRGSVAGILGSVISVSIVNGEARALVRLAEGAAADAVAANIRAGHIRGVSVGYRVDEISDSVEAGRRVRTATKWTPVEISLVAVPADPASVIRAGVSELANRAQVNVEIRAIARTASLPQAWVDSQIDKGATLDQARESAFAALQFRSAAANSIRTASVVGFSSDDPEWRIRTIGEALHCRMAGGTPSEAARPFVGLSMLELARDCLRVRGLSTTGGPAAIVERAMSMSDLPFAMGDALDRTVRHAYELAPSALKRVSRQVTARDFRKRHRLQMSSAPTLAPVGELGEFQHGALADQEETYALSTFGRIIGLSRQVVINDDLGMTGDLTRRMGLAAAGFEADKLADLLASGPNMADGKAPFHADHGNLAASGTAISETTLTAARLAMRKQTEPGGQKINITPRYLIAPPDLETLAEKTISAIQATTTSDVNAFAFLSLIIEPRLTDAYAWYLVADPASIDGIEHCYLEGQVGPQVFSEVGFEVDGVKFKIRLDFACAWVEYRGFYKNPGH